MSREAAVRLIRYLLLGAGCIGCAFVSLPGAGILLLTGLLICLTDRIAEKKRSQDIAHLCNEIDDILRGAEHVQLDSYREGELSILTEEIRKMTVRLREQNAALVHDRQYLKESLEDMSHQLRTPLTTAMVLLGRLRKAELSREERASHVQELFSMLSRMQWMLETLLNYSRLDAGAVTFHPEDIALREIVRAAMEPLEITMELSGITLVTELRGEPHFCGDRSFCTEALLNILKNCMEHTPAGGTITVRGEENAIYTVLTVTDTGSGIAEEDLPHIFERFYRGKSFSGSGYGIGLAFARRIVGAQNGSLQVRNAEPCGAEFEIRFYKTVV